LVINRTVAGQGLFFIPADMRGALLTNPETVAVELPADLEFILIVQGIFEITLH